MHLTRRLIGCLLVATALHACATPVTPRYSANTDNILALRKLNTSGVYVGEIAEPSKDDVKCRGIGRMRLQDGLTHAQFIRRALVDELKLAGAFADAPGRVTLTGGLIEIDSSSGMGDGHWSMALLLRSSNGGTMKVSNVYSFHAGFAATAACNNVAQAFVPAVQEIIGKAVRSSEFASLLR